MAKIKKVTIEKLAQMSQKEFTAIRSEMKEGFDGVGKQLDKNEEDMSILRRDMEAGFGMMKTRLNLAVQAIN